MILFGSLAAKRASLYPEQNISFYSWEVLFPLLCFAIVFGMRYGVGVDHLGYLNSYISGERVDRYELGFKWLTIFFSENDLHYSVYFGVLAFLQVFFFFYAYKDERFLFPYLAFVLFAGGYYLAWMNGIRQDLAACMFIYSFKFIDQKKFWKYLLWCAVAFLFHKSAIILVVLYPVLKNGRDYFRSTKLQLVIFFAALVIYYSGFRIENVFSTQIDLLSFWFRYDYYTMDEITNKASVNNTGIGFILAAVIDLVIILFSSTIKKYFNSKRFLNSYTLYFVGTIALIIIGGSNVLARPFRYLIYFKLIVAAYLIYYLFKTAKLSFNQVIFFLIVLIYFSLFGALLYRGESNTAKFVFFWQV